MTQVVADAYSSYLPIPVAMLNGEDEDISTTVVYICES